MKKFFKILTAVVFLMVTTVFVFFIYSVAQLPHPAALRKMVEPQPTVVEANNATAVSSKTSTTETPKTSQVATQPNVEPPKPGEEERVKDFVQEYVHEDFTDIRVCQNLGKLHDKMTGHKSAGLNEDFFKTLQENDRENSLQESWRTSLKFVFQQDSLKNLFKDLSTYDDLPKDERSSMLQKLGFYTKAVGAVADLYRKKGDIENFANHSYHLSLIAQVVNQKPELANDQHILDFCYQMQNSMAGKKKNSPQEERAEILSLIDYAGLKPADLNFNPDQYIHFTAKVDKKSLQFGFMSQ